MGVASVTAAGRRAALARMTSTATIRRKSGDQQQVAGLWVDTWDTVATVPCRVSSGNGRSRTVSVGDEEVEVAARFVHVPMGTAVLTDDYLQVTGGRVFRVVNASPDDQTTALRLPVVEVAQPEEW